MKKRKLKQLRHLLHQTAELSHFEKETSNILKEYIHELNPDNVICFDYGFAAIWDSNKVGDTIMFRADMDALPIQENCKTNYCSKSPNVSHCCGHDGHMTILYGLASRIAKDPPDKGKVVLLFQPAEETGEGAKLIVNNPDFKAIKPNRVFGLHNVPGYKLKTILLKRDSFACASRGMIIKLIGKTSHAAEPENGNSPVHAIEKLISRFNNLNIDKSRYDDFTLLTIIHIKLGEIAFGTTPGYAEFMLTLRSATNKDMQKLVSDSEAIVRQVCLEEHLESEISYREIFPAVINDNDSFEVLSNACNKLGLEKEILSTPFKWSEDFAYFTNKYKGTFFGLGAGVEHANLHNPEYDFPDEIIFTGVEIFYQIYKECLIKG